MQVASLAGVINQRAFKSSMARQGQNFEIYASFDIVLHQERKNLPLSLQKSC